MDNIIKELIKFKEDFKLTQMENENLKQRLVYLENLIKSESSNKNSISKEVEIKKLNQDDYLLSVAETAERLKTNRNYVYELIEKGFLNCLIMGSKKVRNSEINRFLAEYEGKDLSDLNKVTIYKVLKPL